MIPSDEDPFRPLANAAAPAMYQYNAPPRPSHAQAVLNAVSQQPLPRLSGPLLVAANRPASRETDPEAGTERGDDDEDELNGAERSSMSPRRVAVAGADDAALSDEVIDEDDAKLDGAKKRPAAASVSESLGAVKAAIEPVKRDVKAAWFNFARAKHDGDLEPTDLRNNLRICCRVACTVDATRKARVFVHRVYPYVATVLLIYAAYAVGSRHVDLDRVSCVDHLQQHPSDSFHRHGRVVCVRPQPGSPASDAVVFKDAVIDFQRSALLPGALKRDVVVNTEFCQHHTGVQIDPDQQKHGTTVDCWHPLIVHHSQQREATGDILSVPYSDAICAAMHYISIEEYCLPIHQRTQTPRIQAAFWSRAQV